MDGGQKEEGNIISSKVVDPDSFNEAIEDVNISTSDEYSSWIRRHITLQAYTSQNEYADLFDATRQSLEQSLSTESIQENFKTTVSKKRFNLLLTNYAFSAGRLDEIINKHGISKLSNDDSSNSDQAIYNFADVFIDPNFSMDGRMELSELHFQALEESQENFLRVEAQLRKDFETSLRAAVEKGELPASAIANLDRIQDIGVVITDPVVDRAKDRGGFYDASRYLVGISAEVVGNPEMLKKVYFHEMLHVLSGRTIVETTTEYEDEGYDFKSTNYNPNRIGLDSLGNYEINEAYTEWAAMTLLGERYDQEDLWRDAWDIESRGLSDKYGSVYLPERILLAGIVAGRVDMDLVGKAYFESYIPKSVDKNLTRGQRAPNRWELDAAIKNKIGEPSLNKLINTLRGKRATEGRNTTNETVQMARNLASLIRNKREQNLFEVIFGSASSPKKRNQ